MVNCLETRRRIIGDPWVSKLENWEEKISREVVFEVLGWGPMRESRSI